MANYGGILQNYALQKALKRLGHEVYTFDVGKFTWIDWVVNTMAISYHKLKCENVHYEKNPLQRRKIEMPLRRFVRKYITLIEPRQYNLNMKCLYRYHINAFVVGSDQVWRPKYNHDLPDKYLAFLDDKEYRKIAYAASFGTDEWEYTEKEQKICSALAKKFHAISVRESSAVNLCSKYLDVRADHVLDPTLLLNKSDYEELCTQIPSKEPFVFAYILDSTEQKVSEIKRFAEIKGLPFYIMKAESNVSNEDSIEKWLSNFRDSRYIITDSFHGTVFSIVFNKPFWIFGNNERGFSRFASLLGSLNLESRLIKSITDVEDNAIDWDRVNSQVKKLQVHSINWLKINLSI